MSATRPIGVGSTTANSEEAVRAQLDALAKGEIDPETLLNNVKERARSEPDYDWEVLSLLDQYYRRGKIELDVFRTLKNGFAEYILGPKNSAPAEAASPRSPAPAPAAPAAAAPQAPTLHTIVTPPAKPQPAHPPAALRTLSTGSTASPATPPAPAHPPTVVIPAAAAPSPPQSQTPRTPAPVATTVQMPTSEPSVRTATDPAREAEIGDLLRNRYRLESVLGRGTSGTVFEATDPLRLNLPPAGKRVAIKVMHPDPRGVYIEQLRQEFHSLQTLSHPNIVRAFDFDRDGAIAFFTMELLGGEHLNSVLRVRGAPFERQHSFAIVRDVGDAMAYAHSRGIVHGDINPRNIFVTTRGEVRVLRFGAWNRLSGNHDAAEFEQASAVPDTGRYASCEVLHGNRPNESDDLYSLACLTYLLLTGRHAYADRTSIEARAERKHPRRPSGLTYKQWVTLRAGLQTDVKKRPSDVKSWLQGLELSGAAKHLPPTNELTEAPEVKSSRWQWVVLALIIVALGVGGYLYYLDSEEQGPTAEHAQPATAPDSDSPDATLNPSEPPPGALTPDASQTAVPPAQHAAPPPPPVTLKPAPPAAPGGAQPATTVPASKSPASPPVATPSGAAGSVAHAPDAASATHPSVAAPSQTRVEMASDTIDALPTDAVIRVTVRRKGSLRGATSFTWWTESGTAKPGVDFAPVLPHVQQMQDGEASTVLSVVVLPTLRSSDKGFYVGIEEADGGAQIGGRSLTQVTLPATN